MGNPLFPSKNGNSLSYIWHSSGSHSPETTPGLPVPIELQTEQALFRIAFLDFQFRDSRAPYGLRLPRPAHFRLDCSYKRQT
jgi:hypothetical protein